MTETEKQLKTLILTTLKSSSRVMQQDGTISGLLESLKWTFESISHEHCDMEAVKSHLSEVLSRSGILQRQRNSQIQNFQNPNVQEHNFQDQTFQNQYLQNQNFQISLQNQSLNCQNLQSQSFQNECFRNQQFQGQYVDNQAAQNQSLIQNIQNHDLQNQNSRHTENVQLFQKHQSEFQQINTHLPKLSEYNVQQPDLEPIEQSQVGQQCLTQHTRKNVEREPTLLSLREIQ